MNTFTASNGMTVERRANEDVVIDGYTTFMSDGTALALREFFRAEEDERLGRWRWHENPEYVVYTPVGSSRYVRVLNERDAILEVIHQERLDGRASLMAQAARAYFDAHPEPKPWHEAQVGDVWVIRLRGEDHETACLVESFEDTHVFQVPDAESITTTRDVVEAARRIWPEVAS